MNAAEYRLSAHCSASLLLNPHKDWVDRVCLLQASRALIRFQTSLIVPDQGTLEPKTALTDLKQILSPQK